MSLAEGLSWLDPIDLSIKILRRYFPLESIVEDSPSQRMAFCRCFGRQSQPITTCMSVVLRDARRCHGYTSYIRDLHSCYDSVQLLLST